MMFFNLIPQLVIVLALAGIIVILSRKHPVAAEKEKELLEVLKKIKLIKKIDYRKYFNFVKAQIAKLRIIMRQKRKNLEIKKEKKSGIEVMIEEQKYIKIISQDPKNLFAYHKLGKLYFEQKNYDDARAVFEQVLKIDEKNKRAKEMLEKTERLLG